MKCYCILDIPRISLLLLIASLLAACGTFEVQVEMPGEARPTGLVTVVVALTAEGVPSQSPATTPTPIPVDFDPGTARPIFTPMPARDYPAPAGLRIAFFRGDQLWLWSAEAKEALALVSTGRTNGEVKVSDDGHVIAFLKGNDLWAVNSDGTGERELLSVEALDAVVPADQGVSASRLEWVPGTHTLALNTRLQMAHGLVLNDDLHLLDANTLELTTLLPSGEGGEFYYSPDGSQLAVVSPGEISLVDSTGEQRERVLTYTPVNTASEYRFYARPYWAADGSALRVAIPPAEPHALPFAPTTIWHVPTDGEPARMLTSIDAAPMLSPDSPAFSPDLAFVAYAQLRLPEGATLDQAEPWLEVQRLADGARQAYPYAHDLVRWAPDSQRFAFLASERSPQLYIGRWSGSTMPGSAQTDKPVYDVRWVDAEHYLFIVRSSAERGPAQDGWDLVLGDIHGSSTILASMESYPHYDFGFNPSAAQPTGPTEDLTPTPTATNPTPEHTPPTPTPVATLPGLVYQMDGELWIDRGGQRTMLLNRHVDQLSPDGVLTLYVAGDGDDRDLWLAVLPLGDQHNLTRTPDRNEDNPRWWASQPEVVVFSSMSKGEALGSGAIGYLTAVKTDGSGYRILDDQHYLNSPPAPAPDGRTIAYGSNDGGWLYRWDMGPQSFDPAEYGLVSAGEIELGAAAWSPDGTKLAWVLAGDLDSDGSFRWGIAVFDFVARSCQILNTHGSGGGDGWPPAPVWSPDGTWLAFEARAGSAEEAGVWIVGVDGQGEDGVHLGGYHPVWSPDGQWLALSNPAPDRPGHWMANVGSWHLLALDLPLDAQIVDWIDPTAASERVGTSNSSSPCALSPLQVPMVVPWTPAPEMLCLKRDDPESGQTARILSYGTDASSVAPGDKITISWDVEGSEMALLEVYDWASIQQAQKRNATSVPLMVLEENLPLTGTHTVVVPDDLVGGTRIVLWVAGRGPPGSAVAMYKRLAFGVIDLPRHDG